MEKSQPSIGITVPTWNRFRMVTDCVLSLCNQDYAGAIEIMVVDDRSTDATVEELMGIAETCEHGGYAGPRSIRFTHGPGYSNWMPGAIHFPVFRHWLQTKTDLVSYQFSDEMSHPSRISSQVDFMLKDNYGQTTWSYCGNVKIIDGHGNFTGRRTYRFNKNNVPGICLMTPSILVDRKKFEEVGGLDYPIHAAAQAESWIIAHAAMTGPVSECPLADAYIFREHHESLGNGQKPNSDTYHKAVAHTGFVEEDHWRLWNRIGGEFDERIKNWKRTQ